MSRSLNRVALLGNVGSDPEVRSVNNGSRVASFSLATGKQWTDAQGMKQEKTEWHKCVAWNTKTGTLADVVDKYVKKGDRLYVEGEIEYRQWTDKEGQTRYTTEIKVREIVLLGGKSDGPNERSASTKRDAKPTSESSDFLGALEDDDDAMPF